MKTLLQILVFISLPVTMQAQGLFGLGTPDLGKKKIESIELVLENADKVSPSSVFLMGLVAKDKKGKQFKTEGLEGGDYPLQLNYDIKIENGTVNEYGELSVTPVNQLQGDKVKISVVFKSNPALVAEKTVDINYLGKILVNFRGDNGRNASPGETGYPYSKNNPNGQNGSDASNNAEQGEGGGSVQAHAWLEKINDANMIRMVTKSLTSGDIVYYQTKAEGANITIDASGGKGGNGGNGGSGGSGKKDLGGRGGNGGSGSDGADGGNGGSISLTIDENRQPFKNAFHLINAGGKMGAPGEEGRGGAGYANGKNGMKGRPGRMGKNGPTPQVIISKPEVKWYN